MTRQRKSLNPRDDGNPPLLPELYRWIKYPVIHSLTHSYSVSAEFNYRAVLVCPSLSICHLCPGSHLYLLMWICQHLQHNNFKSVHLVFLTTQSTVASVTVFMNGYTQVHSVSTLVNCSLYKKTMFSPRKC